MKHLLQFDVWAWAKPFFLREAPELKVERRYPNFDLLRLFLALEVVATHIYDAMLKPGYLIVPVAPVACFVCLSGFLIPSSLQRSREKFAGWSGIGDFAKKRVLRTIPALIPMLLFVGLAMGSVSVRDSILNYFTAGSIGLHNVTTLWSLGVEDALYICMAVLFCAGAYRRPWAIWALFVAVTASVFLITDGMDRYRFWSTSCAFLAGGVLWLYRDRIDRTPLWLPAVALPICFALIRAWPTFNVIGLPLTCASAVLLAANLPALAPKKMPDLSYGTYIWHGPLLFWLAEAVHRELWPLLAIGYPLTAAVATGSWYLVEKPALKLKNRGLRLFARSPEVAMEAA